MFMNNICIRANEPDIKKMAQNLPDEKIFADAQINSDYIIL